jgi:5-methylcytosine-specific restriction endonuclease McrA
MMYHFKCPVCQRKLIIDWEKRGTRKKCPSCGSWFAMPTPLDQKDAYVDTHNWPVEMENLVYATKGTQCSVPGCSKKAETLDHRIPYSEGGKTSVENLFPMCNSHNQSKGDTNYDVWLATQR